MAAYAALTSLMHIIEQIDHHPLPPIFIHKQQVVSLTKIVAFLQEFLEAYNPHVGSSEEADPMEMRIADAAYAVEDVIESYIATMISCSEKTHNFSENLERLIEEMDLIKMEVVGIVEERRVGVQNLQVREVAAEAQDISMVGFDDVLLDLMDKLTAGRLDRQVIPIVGMGGIGKTTLARNVYVHPLIKDHFDICAWATISHQHSRKEILGGILPQASKESKERLSKMSEEELGLALYQYLMNRRFLIVMDDMWSIEIWHEINHFFPDNNNGSRVVVTTRLSELASQLDNDHRIEMKFLDGNSSWNLFSKTVFGEKSCPVELGKIGGKIVRNCRGLPLSIVAIGGLLAESEHTLEYWEHIEENLNSIVNSDKDEHCLKILKLSYSHLPTHLKPCFLYMGVFDEDSKIRVSTLIRLWVSEGFLKPTSGASFETTAKEYLKDLVARNLVIVHELGSIGGIKYCKVHDLLRDLCLREAQREGFYDNIKQCREQNVLHESRSYVCDVERIQKLPNLRSLRTLKAYDRDTNRRHGVFMDDVLQLVNLRYLSISLLYNGSIFPSLVNLLWNLHTLIIAYTKEGNAPVDIWKMPQLRHAEFRDGGVRLPNPPSDNIVAMENLQTLTGARDFECSEEVVRRIPNVKKLGIRCHKYLVDSSSDNYCLSNLEHLQELQSLSLSDKSGSYDHLQRLTFPHSLKKLSLEILYIHWEEMLENIGSLPVLQKLRLTYGSLRTGEWNTVEDQFPSLKFLALESCFGLEYWTTESSHFPRLEHLRLIGLRDLKKIPSEIGDIPTLQSIELDSCCGSAVKSAQKIMKEQEELQGEQLPFTVLIKNYYLSF